MRLKDVNGTKHELEASDVAVVESAGHPVATVPGADGEPKKAPLSIVHTNDGRSFVMAGPVEGVHAMLHPRPRAVTPPRRPAA